MALKRRLGAKVLRAVASALRLNILRLLYDRGPLSYTEIMSYLKLSPSRDAGRFAYHLKMLLNMDLISSDPSLKKYRITDLGRSLVEFADDLENKAYREQMLVRTSRLAIERFDRNKIAEALVREGDVPADLSHRIAREAERRLLKLGTKYITAPLIREFVNAILLEHGLEEYRHKMTRLGFPVYDITLLLKEMSERFADVEQVQMAAGRRVFEEYALLSTLPRDVADAHISGEIHIENLGDWVLKPSIIMHDARSFLHHGLTVGGDLSKINFIPKPKSLRAALCLLRDLLQLTSAEVSKEQCLDFINIFLAPYAENLRAEDIKEEIKLFLTSVNLTVPTGVSLGIEMGVPSFLAEEKAYGPDEVGVYGDYVDESIKIASAFLECIKDSVETKPILNPSVIVKLRDEFSGGESEKILYLAHELAVHGIPYFANLMGEEQRYASYTALGSRLSADWRGDWEIDVIRTGCLDYVVVNLPRAAYESDREEDKFFKEIQEYAEKGLMALRIKHQTIRERADEDLLPIILQRKNGDRYFRIENALSVLSFVGLDEAIQFMTEESIRESRDALRFAEKIITKLSDQTERYGRKAGIRLKLGFPSSFEAATRLAQLDIERYGLGVALTHGERENPYYTGLNDIPYHTEISIDEYLEAEMHLHRLTPGSHMTKISLKDEFSPDDLMETTRMIIDQYNIGFYAYDRPLTYCSNCQRTWHGERLKCPICNSVNTLARFRRRETRYRTERIK
ncbi:ArsR family transcriptional regulator [Candidatus Bathyarchaeota archaeon]|nr:ArsR family transcriptional regulator [Candidatus Bathyarchaeota archaeon]